MTFRNAVEATPSVKNHYCAGLQALRTADTKRLKCPDPRRLTGSVNLDKALEASQPNAPRWDYGIGLRRNSAEKAVWVEVHPASSTSINEMLEKLSWLKNWLNNDAPELRRLTHGDYWWVSTDATIVITHNSRQAKQLAAAGLRGPTRTLNLA